MQLTITIPDDKAGDVLQFLASMKAAPVKPAETITGRRMTRCGRPARVNGPGYHGLSGEIEIHPGFWREYHWHTDGTSCTGYIHHDLIAQ